MTRDRRMEIADRAHEIWEQEGRPHGKALEHWLRAETELQEAVREADSSPAATHQPKRPGEPASAGRRGSQARGRKRTRQPPPKKDS